VSVDGNGYYMEYPCTFRLYTCPFVEGEAGFVSVVVGNLECHFVR